MLSRLRVSEWGSADNDVDVLLNKEFICILSLDEEVSPTTSLAKTLCVPINKTAKRTEQTPTLDLRIEKTSFC
ncbi:Uncharacterised protein [Streptococcus pneumoniae]|nr:Uncharacterised protein [Streptococcus pneumoniae]